MKICGVYMIVNTLTWKVYMGSSVNVSVRWTEHRRLLRKGQHHSPHLQRAWDKDGEGAFECVVIEGGSPLTVVAQEQSWLDAFCSYDKDFGYNIAHVAQASMRGRKHTPEARAKISEGLRKRPPITEETRLNLRRAQKGRKVSEACRAKLSAALKGRPQAPEHVEKRKLRKLSAAHKAALLAVHQGKKRSPEVTAKIVAKTLGQKRSPEACARMREAALNRSEASRLRIKEGQHRRGYGDRRPSSGKAAAC